MPDRVRRGGVLLDRGWRVIPRVPEERARVAPKTVRPEHAANNLPDQDAKRWNQANPLSQLSKGEMRILKEQTKMALATLSSREQLVLRMRFGLGQTDKEQALQVLLTPDQVRFIEAMALRKLRQPRPHIGARNVERP